MEGSSAFISYWFLLKYSSSFGSSAAVSFRSCKRMTGGRELEDWAASSSCFNQFESVKE
ncbi:hypothetical protein J7E71_21930 [Mesobacillus foraminis]|uniref:hypothetical protein n=1 Tax=Mesobacillus foraminis TaxID=279826 RepID=UPI001BEAECE0|nr:hypothetical protein [Mesobacillus foraminis]MBT2758534.1 hypothetical protein [Mesobacillus foraminis]